VRRFSVRAANADNRVDPTVGAASAAIYRRAGHPRAAALLAVALLGASGTCAAEGWFLTVGGGGRNIDVDRDSAFANGFSTDGNLVGELGGGYVFSNNLVLEAATTDAVSVTGLFGFASFEFEDDRVMVGYSFPVSETFRIVPTIGASFWDFRATDFSFFGSPNADQALSGTDMVWRIGGDILFGETFGISIGYTRGEFDVGDTSLAGVALRIQF
jgi:hypothetical protein